MTPIAHHFDLSSAPRGNSAILSEMGFHMLYEYSISLSPLPRGAGWKGGGPRLFVRHFLQIFHIHVRQLLDCCCAILTTYHQSSSLTSFLTVTSCSQVGYPCPTLLVQPSDKEVVR